MALDKDGLKLKAGDICEVTVKYLVVKVTDQEVLVQKLYNIDPSVLRKVSEL